MTRREQWFRQVVFQRIMIHTQPLFTALAWLWRRLLFRTTFIAVTGASGKSTTTRMMAAALRAGGPTHETRRNQNGFALTCLNLLRVRPWHRFAVLEVGVERPGQMAPIVRLLRPDVAVITAMTRVHTLGFATIEEHAAEKAVLLRYLRRGGFALLNGDDPLVRGMADSSVAPVVLYGAGEDCDYRASETSSRWPGRLGFVFHGPAGERTIRTQLIGEHWLPAPLASLAAADRLGVDGERAAAKLAGMAPMEGRLSAHQLPNGAVFLRDDYNGCAATLDAALGVMRKADARRRVLAISDISDFDGNNSKRLRHLASRLPGAVEAAVFWGSHGPYAARRAVEAGLDADRAHGFKNLWDAAEFLRSELREGDLVLLKGRTTDHIARLFFAQLGDVGCWKNRCKKRGLCDDCWEMTLPAEKRRLAAPVAAPGAG